MVAAGRVRGGSWGTVEPTTRAFLLHSGLWNLARGKRFSKYMSKVSGRRVSAEQRKDLTDCWSLAAQGLLRAVRSHLEERGSGLCLGWKMDPAGMKL